MLCASAVMASEKNKGNDLESETLMTSEESPAVSNVPAPGYNFYQKILCRVQIFFLKRLKNNSYTINITNVTMIIAVIIYFANFSQIIIVMIHSACVIIIVLIYTVNVIMT